LIPPPPDTGDTTGAAMRNLVPRYARRASIDLASGAEWDHDSAVRRGVPHLPPCWFCVHEAREHMKHDDLVAGCPDCETDAGRREFARPCKQCGHFSIDHASDNALAVIYGACAACGGACRRMDLG
jgi:hypothetical protein